jgi:hypothetical protein
MNKWIVFLALILISSASYATTISLTANCSHFTATTDVSNARIDIFYNVGGNWETIYAMEAPDGTGRLVKPTVENGTHRAAVRQGTGAIIAYSPSIDVTTCVPPRTCTAKSDCTSGEYCASGVCAAGECAINGDCPTDKYCQSTHTCAMVSCPCGTVNNHLCSAYQCCYDANCTGGKICSNHACVANVTTPQVDPAKTAAEKAIADAQTEIDNAVEAGKDVTSAKSLLSQAKAKLNSKDYSGASSSAAKAEAAAKSAKTSTGTNTGEQTTQPSPFSFLSGNGLLCCIGVAVVVLGIGAIILGVAAYFLFFKKKK